MEEDDDSKIFPQKLMEILNDPENQEAICWLPHGNAFTVRNRELFSEKVMPRYFSRKAKYSSFTRKLNRWNFFRVSSGPELGSYHHEFFVRDKPQLAAQMFCKNARTMLAMASASSKKASSEPSGKSTKDSRPPQTMDLPSVVPSRAFLSPGSLIEEQKDTATSTTHLAAPHFASGSTNLQMVERQIQALQQQEQANRMLLENALMMQQHQQPLMMQELQNVLQQQKLQQERIMQMRHMMQLSVRRQEELRCGPRMPSNNRASAA